MQPALPGDHGVPYVPEPTDRVERLLAAATARRKREERQAGQRRFTIADGWEQRPGAGHANVGADEDGWGWK